ncbi:MAG: flagellar type III secretion system pore protein FliP [Acidimicrobiia bacterium]
MKAASMQSRPSAVTFFSVVGVALLDAAPALAQTITLDLAGGGSVTRSAFNLFAITTLLAVAPSIAIVMTSFTRIVVVLSLVRSAIGLQQTPPNIVLTSLAVFMTLFIMSKTADEALRNGLEPYFAGTIAEEKALEETTKPFHRFMLANTRPADLDVFLGFSGRNEGAPRVETQAEIPLRTLIPAFMMSELRVAFEIGFLLYLPFLVIDLVVSAILMAMGMMMLPPVLVALPFKIVYFVFTDGWRLLVVSLLQSYQV